MPTIEGKKSKNIHFVTAEAWDKMQENGLARRYNVIDNSDIEQTIQSTPESIVDFTDKPVGGPVDNSIKPILSREEIKERLDDLGLEYNKRAPTDKLLELLNNQ